ncbi:hypothetical protein AB0K09_15205 [Streptomyces sp. NPDC049577]|uniref:hypothetical protein n=1 Tax=Streptomyces sp. NPDC049577 TaxID=3155153 RepID=UPI003413E8B8
MAVPARRVVDGSVVLASQLAGGACAWCRKGYRHDLTGIAAALGPAVRGAGLLGAAWGVWSLVRTAPWLLWIAVPAWSAAAWRITPAVPSSSPSLGGDDEAAAAEPAPALSLDAFSTLVRDLAGGGAGAHLSTLAERITRDPKATSTVRALCQQLGVPVSSSVRQPGRGVSTGVRVKDLPAPSPAPPEDADVAVVPAGQPTATAPATATPVVETHADGALVIIRDPTHHTHAV